jgi:hypothetical protein
MENQWLLTEELKFRWSEQMIDIQDQQEEILNLNLEIQKNPLLKSIGGNLDAFTQFEQQNIKDAAAAVKFPLESLKNIRFKLNPYVQLVESRFGYSKEEKQNQMAVIPKFLAFGELKFMPLFLVYERRFFLQFRTLENSFTIDDLIEKTMTKNTGAEADYLADFYTYLLRRFNSLHLLIQN